MHKNSRCRNSNKQTQWFSIRYQSLFYPSINVNNITFNLIKVLDLLKWKMKKIRESYLIGNICPDLEINTRGKCTILSFYSFKLYNKSLFRKAVELKVANERNTERFRKLVNCNDKSLNLLSLELDYEFQYKINAKR